MSRRRPSPRSRSGDRAGDPALPGREPAKRPATAIAVSAALPGGDPLAAALAAGETPSPEMVAAAGRHRGGAVGDRPGGARLRLRLLRPGGLRGERRSPGGCRWSVRPGAGGSRRQVVQKLGYASRRSIASAGSPVRTTTHAGRAKRGRRALDELATGRTPAMNYWHRTSPHPLVPTGGGLAQVDDPPLRVGGMTLAILDPRGRLLEFHGVPPQRAAPAATPPAALAGGVHAVGWPRDRFAPATPEWTPPHPDRHPRRVDRHGPRAGDIRCASKAAPSAARSPSFRPSVHGRSRPRAAPPADRPHAAAARHGTGDDRLRRACRRGAPRAAEPARGPRRSRGRPRVAARGRRR